MRRKDQWSNKLLVLTWAIFLRCPRLQTINAFMGLFTLKTMGCMNTVHCDTNLSSFFLPSFPVESGLSGPFDISSCIVCWWRCEEDAGGTWKVPNVQFEYSCILLFKSGSIIILLDNNDMTRRPDTAKDNQYTIEFWTGIAHEGGRRDRRGVGRRVREIGRRREVHRQLWGGRSQRRPINANGRSVLYRHSIIVDGTDAMSRPRCTDLLLMMMTTVYFSPPNDDDQGDGVGWLKQTMCRRPCTEQHFGNWETGVLLTIHFSISHVIEYRSSLTISSSETRQKEVKNRLTVLHLHTQTLIVWSVLKLRRSLGWTDQGIRISLISVTWCCL